MSPSAIVQKLWNSACLVPLGADKYCNVLRDDLSAWDLPALQQAGAQAGGMSYLLARCAQASGDYPSTELRAGVEELTKSRNIGN